MNTPEYMNKYKFGDPLPPEVVRDRVSDLLQELLGHVQDDRAVSIIMEMGYMFDQIAAPPALSDRSDK